MQLDATLHSYEVHCKDHNDLQLTVLYKASSEQYRKQYLTLVEQYESKNVHFYPERSFRSDLLTRILLTEAETNYQWISCLSILPPVILNLLPTSLLPAPQGKVLFLVDDAIFVNDISLLEIRETLDNQPDSLGFSLRLGANTSYCYSRDTFQNLPTFAHIQGNILKYRWMDSEVDFKYPLEISSSIYRLEDIYPLLLRIPFQNPNFLEGNMARHARDFSRSKPSLLCFEHSAAFCIPINKVQNVVSTRSGGENEYPPDRLADLFDAGYRIDIHAYSGFVPNGCHQEVELFFENTG